MVWEPVNLAEKCPMNANFTACSQFGYFYISLLAHLYGDSAERRKRSQLENEKQDDCLLIAEAEDTLNKYFKKTDAGKHKNKEAGVKFGTKNMNDAVKDLLEKKHNKCACTRTLLHSINKNHKRDDNIDENNIFDGNNDEIERKMAYDKCISDKDKLANEKENKMEYDFIVVGAGSAGCVVARRLIEEDFEVLLLEAGLEEPDITMVPSLNTCLQGSNIDWQYYSQPDGKSCLAQPYQRCALPAGRVMGGSSSINSMAYVRGNKLDFDTWAALGNKGWSYKDVLPFFMKSENNLNCENQNRKCHGVDGPQTISRYPYIDDPGMMMISAYNERGIPIRDFNCDEQIGTEQSQAFSKGGKRMSTNTAYIHPMRHKRNNLTVRVESVVTKILINNGRAYGVEYTKGGKSYTAKAKNEVIISAGPMNSPKLLMLSGIGLDYHLKEANIEVKKNLSVGCNLHDHVTFDGVVIILPNKTATTVDNEQLLKHIIDYKKMETKGGPLSGIGPVNSIAFMKTDPCLLAPNIQFQSDRIRDWREYVQAPAAYKFLSIFPSAFYNGMIVRAMCLDIKSRGTLRLNVTDVHGRPIIHANYLGDPSEEEALIKAMKFLYTLEDTKAFKERGAYFYKEPLKPCDSHKWGTVEYISCLIRSLTSSTYHVVGTCKMGPKEDKNAVVDNELRVYGIDALRVIDSSIMPIVTRGNTNAPTIMLAERGVDFVIKQWANKKRCIDLPRPYK